MFSSFHSYTYMIYLFIFSLSHTLSPHARFFIHTQACKCFKVASSLHTNTHTLSLPLTRVLYLPRYTQSHNHTHNNTQSHTNPHTQSHTQSQTHNHTHNHTDTISQTHTITHKLIYPAYCTRPCDGWREGACSRRAHPDVKMLLTSRLVS